MSEAKVPVFDQDALRCGAGDAAFKRGKAYHSAGHVELITIEPRRVLAHVAGSDVYRVEITGGGARIDGACTCPAYADSGFCKHMVATALAVNAAGSLDAATGALARIRKHLRGRDRSELVRIILDLAERDPALFRRLDLAAAMDEDDDAALAARLRKALDAATRTRGFVDYREAREWAAGVEAALGALADLASGPRAQLARDLVDGAIARIEAALEDIDDSDGYCGALLEQAREIHLAACLAAPPDPVALAPELFTREAGDAYGTFDSAARDYATVLGDAGLEEYRRLARETWDTNLSPHTAEGGRIADILDFFAERAGDVETRIAIRARDLGAPHHYWQLARFCLENGRASDALKWAEDGLWIFEDDRPDERLLVLAVDLLQKSGCAADAEAHLWRAFDRAPTMALYRRLREGGRAAARDRALASLRARPRRDVHASDLHPDTR